MSDKANTITINNVKISTFEPQIDKAKIDEKYDFYRLSTSEKYFKDGRTILDLPVLKGHIQSITYEGGDTFGARALFIMTPAATLTAPVLRQAINNAKIETVLVEDVKATGAGTTADFKDIDLFRLLLHASFNSDVLPFDNIADHLWIQKKVEKKKDEICKIITVTVNVENDFSFSLDIQTFSGKALEKCIRYPAGYDWEKMPKYVYHLFSGQMLPTSDDDKVSPKFIKRACGTKSELKFLGFSNSKEFDQAKIGTLYDVEKAFNQKYEGIARIEYKCVPEVEKHILDSVLNSKKADICSISWKVENIAIVDLVNDKDGRSKRVCVRLVDHFMRLGIPVDMASKPRKGSNNLVLIHEPEWYKEHGKQDMYQDYKSGYVVQHLEIESIQDDLKKMDELTPEKIQKGQSNPVIQAILHNFQFKKDLENKVISAVDLAEFNRTGSWLFGMRKRVRDEDRKDICMDYFGFLELRPDGSIGTWCAKGEEALFHDENSSAAADTLFAEDNAECVIQDELGNIVILEDTGLFPLPNLSEMKETLEQADMQKGVGVKGQHPILVGTEYEVANPRLDLWGALGDVNFFSPDIDNFYYYVDEPGKSMKQTAKSSTHIRKISGNNARVIGEKLMPTFCNTEIRNGLPSVLPFACKYIREKILQEYPELRFR